MARRSTSAIAETGTPGEIAALRRALTAVLRWRLRWLRRAFPARTVDAARLLALTLHACFDRTRLSQDAPGVAGLRYRRSWTALARAFELPPPCRPQRGPPLVEAILAIPAGEMLEVLVVVAPTLRAVDAHAIAARTRDAVAHLGTAGARLDLRVTDPVKLAKDPEASHRAAAFGALVAGRLSIAAWGALEGAGLRPIGGRTAGSLAAAAPSPLASLALTLVAATPSSAPIAAAARLLRRGVPARALADPAVLCARWAADAAPRHRAALEQVAALVGAAARSGPAPVPDAGEVLALGRGLSLAAARAIRVACRDGLGPHARLAWREALGADLPRALLPALGARLSDAGPLRTTLARAGAAHEVRLPGGAVLGRGATPIQARVRALSLLAASALEPLFEHAEPPWRALASRLGQRRERSTLLLVVEPAGPSGPPFDPLNRGPERAIGFPGALAVRVAPGRRPSGRVVTGMETVELLVREARAGGAVEVLPSRSEAHPVAARLAQLAALVRDGSGSAAVALEAGGGVLVPHAGGIRRYSLGRYAARPRVFVPDPDAPDLALSPGERRPIGLGGARVVECRAHLVDAARAAILYCDATRGRLREIVFLAELEEHLREARAILQAADPGAVLAVRLSEDIEPAIRRMGTPGAPVQIAVRGRLPHALEVEVGGVRFGGASGRSWRDAALTILTRWPREPEARIAVTAVTVAAAGQRAGGLLALYARSVAVRRLRLHVLRALRAYQARAARRKPG